MLPAFLLPTTLRLSHHRTHAPLLTSQSPSLQMSSPKVHIGDVSSRVGTAVKQLSDSCIAEKGSFSVAISGGSLPRLLAAGLPDSLPYDQWNVFLADERVVPLDDDDSNYKLVRGQLPKLSVVPIDPTLDADECARDYQKRLVEKMGDELVFDVVLLGIGPDGHTCSLFPGHPLLQEKGRVVAPITDSPKPPPTRVTLTYPALNAAKAAMFVCTGSGKAPVVKDILENTESTLPGALVKSETVEWFLDEAAASELTQTVK